MPSTLRNGGWDFVDDALGELHLFIEKKSVILQYSNTGWTVTYGWLEFVLGASSQ
jgi:hypothetical protein